MYLQIFKGLKNVFKIDLNILSCLLWAVTLGITDYNYNYNYDCACQKGGRALFMGCLLQSLENIASSIMVFMYSIGIVKGMPT